MEKHSPFTEQHFLRLPPTIRFRGGSDPTCPAQPCHHSRTRLAVEHAAAAALPGAAELQEVRETRSCRAGLKLHC